MIFFERGEVSSGSNPALDYWFAVAGILVSPDTTNRFQIIDATGSTPAKIFPAVDDWSTAVEELSEGHWVALWNGAEIVNDGLHILRIDTEHDGVALVFEIPFDVLPAGLKRFSKAGSYCLLSDLRSAGVPVASVGDKEALIALSLAAKQIENFTDRQFGPIGKTLRVDGRGSPDLLIDEPICALASLEILTNAFGSEAIVEATDLTDVEIYNRHLRGLTQPDDRDDPKVSFRRLHDHLGMIYEETRPLFPQYLFPFGQQNVILQGVFGYTEDDGSPVGGTPLLIRRAATMLASLLSAPAAQQVGSVSASRGPIVKERTRDQEVQYAKPDSLGGAQPGPFTGDAAIDNLILPFVKPVRIGAA